jgi:hypothetical protein
MDQDSRPKLHKFMRSLGIRFRKFVYRNRTNAPFLSGDSIASLVDYIAFGKSGKEPIDLSKLNKAKSVFVCGDLIDSFLKKYSSEISARVLISGNSDRNFDSIPELPDSIGLFLCQNNTVDFDERVRTLPIGLENLSLGRSGQKKYYNNRKVTYQKDSLVLIPPMSPTNPIRDQVLELTPTLPWFFHNYRGTFIEKDYFEMVGKYKFILCCEGNGFDTHRVWETLYQGSFPILFKTPWALSLEYLKLPILYVENLEEIDQDLLRKFSMVNSKFNPKKVKALWTPFWKNQINQMTQQ